MSVWNVVVLDGDTLPKRPFALDFEHNLVWYGQTAAEDVAARIADADVVVTNKVVVDEAALSGNSRLKLIAVTATGVNNIDLAAARRLGVAVCNVRAYGNESVAEHAFMLMMALMRNLPSYRRDMRAGLWQQSPFFCHFGAPMRDLNGKTLVVFGRGGIGKTLADYAKAFHMTVLFGEHKGAESVREGYVAFDEAIRRADVLSLHCPLTDQTANMIGAAELAQMKSDAVLINCGRGGLVDEAALLAALQNGTIGGAGVDVLTVEPPKNGHPLLEAQLPNLIVTPHMAWGSTEAVNRLFDMVLDNINAFAAGKPQNIV
ncbi:D-2-hydroxyacid dehydrogenase [Neisseria animalis]|uniref:D-2-hydroxyacid dehydrogenase n=1 Tax=Neisseria animalis TaxID=492 RepID=A0A5P3MQP5_NEIAN|nr:D-2-hydroxyacid dehydrogenase [Neisseria animalis]QEY23904.1 D-2-hydroxyacid dehydrogenase [Neisseria animalis]ROW32028.1 D-2-hydroxyacid dehydrogenase [Neisseria animalis]VEE05833.1 glycerate dehydrogenase [Neisseria animalis]